MAAWENLLQGPPATNPMTTLSQYYTPPTTSDMLAVAAFGDVQQQRKIENRIRQLALEEQLKKNQALDWLYGNIKAGQAQGGTGQPGQVPPAQQPQQPNLITGQGVQASPSPIPIPRYTPQSGGEATPMPNLITNPTPQGAPASLPSPSSASAGGSPPSPAGPQQPNLLTGAGLPTPTNRWEAQAIQDYQAQQATILQPYIEASLKMMGSDDPDVASRGFTLFKQMAPPQMQNLFQDMPTDTSTLNTFADRLKDIQQKYPPGSPQRMQAFQQAALDARGKAQTAMVKEAEEAESKIATESKVKGYDTLEEAQAQADILNKKRPKEAADITVVDQGAGGKYILKTVPNQQMRANIQVNVAGPKAEAAEQGRLKADFTALDKTGIKYDQSTGKIDMNTVPAQIRETAKLVSEYRAQLPSSFALSRPYWQAVLAVAAEMNPNFDQKEYPTRQALMRDFTSGKAAQNIRSINTAIGHLDTFLTQADALSNKDFQTWNRLANRGATEFGDPRLNNFNIAATAIQNEMAAIFKGTGATDQEIAQWRSSFMGAASPAQMHGAANTGWELMQSRIQALKDQYDSGMGGTTDKKILSPTAEKILEKRGMAKKGEPTSAGQKDANFGAAVAYIKGAQNRDEALKRAQELKAKGWSREDINSIAEQAGY